MKRFAVIGLGNFGFNIARTLFEEGHEVIAVDSDRTRIQAVDPYATEAVVLDATDREALKTLGLDETDGVVVSTGPSLSESILICLHLHEMNVSRILVKALDDDHAKILKRVGATDIIFPERDMAQKLARSLSRPNVLDFIPLSDQYDLIQIEPPPEFVGKTIRELNLRARYNVHIIAVKKKQGEDFNLIPEPDSLIEEDLILVILGKNADIKRIKALKRQYL